MICTSNAYVKYGRIKILQNNVSWLQCRTEGDLWGLKSPTPTRNSEVLTKPIRITSSVENISVTT
jgi:hypothetical protein